jgi:glycosyltransferase involved in cell wall biosynthesis
VVSAPLPAGALLALWSRLGRPSLDRLLGRPDVVHGTNFVVPPTRRGAVVTVHDLTPVRYPDLASARTRLFPALVRRAVAAGALVHTPSAFVAGEVIDLLGVPGERVRAVHHGVPPVAVGGGRSMVDGPYVLALGTVEPRKNLVGLVHAFDEVAGELADLRLVIAGADGWGVRAVDDAIVRARHTRRIVRIGYVPAAERWALLVHATVFAYPSVYEGFGFPPLEAMAAGVPVVASPAGALPEVLGDAALLAGPDELAGALVTGVTDEAVRDRLVAAGHRRVAGYSWERCAAGLADIYADAAG